MQPERNAVLLAPPPPPPGVQPCRGHLVEVEAERVRVGDQEIRYYGKPHPAAGYHWGSSQGPGDGFNGGYSNPVLVDWDGDGEWEIVVGADMGFIWYFKPEHFGAASGEFDIFRAADDEGL